MEVVLEAQRAIIFNNRSQKQKQEAEKPGAMSGKGGWYSFTTETQRTQRKARADKGAGETLGCGKKTDTETRRQNRLPLLPSPPLRVGLYLCVSVVNVFDLSASAVNAYHGRR
ncbi:MAG: hypothetical protein ABSF52_13565 [Syntrophobacteraceae bacterium]|jgi:hypothetical protein